MSNPSMVIVDDTSPLIRYGGEWSLEITNRLDTNGNYGPIYNTTQHWTTGNNSFSFSFEGSSVAVLGSNNPRSAWVCSIDGIQIASKPFQYWENNWWMCQSSMEDGPHTLTVNANVADGQMFWFDRIIYTPSASVSLINQALFIDNLNPQIQFPKGWRVNGGSSNITDVAGTKFNFEFDGTSIRWFGYVGGGTPTGSARYSIDGGSPTTFTIATQVAGQASLFNQEYFQTPDLAPGRHVLDVEYLGGEPKAAQLILDYLEVRGATIPSLNTPVYGSPSTAPIFSATDQGGPAQSSTSRGGIAGSVHTDPKSMAGAIVGGVIGGIAFIVIVVFAFLYLRMRAREGRAESIRMTHEDVEEPPAYSDGSVPADSILTPNTIPSAHTVTSTSPVSPVSKFRSPHY